MNNRKVVLVEGIIGAGKSVLTEELGKALGTNSLTLMEPDEKDNANPYLADFYADSKRWALIMQVHLLQARFRMHLQAQWHAMNGYGHAVLDRGFQGDTCFVKMLQKREVLSEREVQTYFSLYQAMTASVLLPSVCVRLKVPPEIALERLLKRMERERGRTCELSIDVEYLNDLDREISLMVDALEKSGVMVIQCPWDDMPTAKERERVVSTLTERILESTHQKPAHMHSRCIG